MPEIPVPKRLREARLEAGLSQKELGVRAGIDEFSASPRINQYERAKHTPDYLTLARLAEVLDVPTSYFYEHSDDLAALIIGFHRSGRQRRRQILKALEAPPTA